MTKLLLLCILLLPGFYDREATQVQSDYVRPHCADLKAGPATFVPLDIIKMR